MILGLNDMTFWGIVWLAFANVVGGVLIHKGGKATTKAFFEDSNNKTQSAINRSAKLIANPSQDLYALLVTKHKGDFDNYYEVLQTYNATNKALDDIVAGRLKIRGGDNLDIPNIVVPAMMKTLESQTNTVIKNWIVVESSLESIQEITQRITNDTLRSSIGSYITKMNGQKNKFREESDGRRDSQAAFAELKEAKAQLMDIISTVAETKNHEPL